MKKLLFVFLIALLCMGLSTPDTASAAMKINKTKATVYIGNTTTLKVTGTNKYVMWKSSNKSIVTVSSKGVIKGIAAGQTTITATIGAGSKNTKLRCEVTVKPRLSAEETNLYCLEDEYYEIPIKFTKPMENEFLMFEMYENEVAEIELEEDNNEYILRIIPQDTGFISLSIFIATGEDFYDLTIKKDEILKININVLPDAEWISNFELDDLGIQALYFDGCERISFSYSDLQRSDSSFEGYIIDNIGYPLEKDKIYSGNGIDYKISDMDTIYFRISDLKKFNIL